jgi:hypothetical protein
MSPAFAISAAMGIWVSTPGIPPGAESKSSDFSARVCGAWSEPNMSMPPFRNSSLSPSREAFSRIGGLTL